MRKNKKIFKKATIGTSLLMSAVLLCGNTVKAHAQADLTPEENQKLAEFLETQPANGARVNLGLTNNVSHSTYQYKGRNNFTSVFESRATKTKLDKDYDFTIDSGDHAGETVHVKNWQDLDVYDLASTETDGPDTSMGRFMFAKEVTFVANDGTEFTEHNVALPVDFDSGERYDNTAYINRYVFDYPIEEADTRFTSIIQGTGDMAVTGGTGYWQLTATVNEEIPYNTIAEIDENLKQGEIVEMTQGEIGNKIGTFNLTVGDDLGGRYLDYDADVIYNDLKDLFGTSSIQKDAFFVRDWGLATFVEGGSVDAKDRVLHVGIDYTQYVTEDGTELKPKEYGVHEKDTFEGYEFVGTHTVANGDTVHVYKRVVAPTPTPEPGQPVTPTNPVEETPVNPTPSPETPVNPTNPGNSGNVNGGNNEDTTSANPTDGETPVNPTPTPNPTPKPDVPVMEDGHGNNTGGNTETPAVPNPAPEPSVPTDETPVQPVNPTEEKPVVPNNPTDNTVVPPTVEEKPVVGEKPIESTVSNKVVENTVVNNTNSSTIKKDDRVIETGVRTNLFTNFAMAVVSGIGLLSVAFKKKESK